jgi:hypothetical protein
VAGARPAGGRRGRSRGCLFCRRLSRSWSAREGRRHQERAPGQGEEQHVATGNHQLVSFWFAWGRGTRIWKYTVSGSKRIPDGQHSGYLRPRKPGPGRSWSRPPADSPDAINRRWRPRPCPDRRPPVGPSGTRTTGAAAQTPTPLRPGGGRGTSCGPGDPGGPFAVRAGFRWVAATGRESEALPCSGMHSPCRRATCSTRTRTWSWASPTPEPDRKEERHPAGVHMIEDAPGTRAARRRPQDLSGHESRGSSTSMRGGYPASFCPFQ